ncbi:sigma-70 family RNA polymerase sigma factor [Clostridium manihotivorum]|uniref:Sigma-70 family RNA polymerase sigma factor n=1 Tax=Clostridium manihotivorum TaxID=2320868 RepID=A0A410DQA6_9CLOT|nr:sigma-70 family RNA polymerase sigma factor [Clostridium manihotivorum]QAA31216.1 hypothetical protein C1I91_05915 [Clostridium manihotivorum]
MKKLKFSDGIYNLAKDEAFLKVEKLIRKIIQNCDCYDYHEYNDLYQVGGLAFIKAYNSYDISKNINFSTYLGKVITNEIGMYHRKMKRHLNVPSLNVSVADTENCELLDIISDQTDYEEVALKNVALSSINLNLLAPNRKQIIYLKFYKNKTQNEIAEFLGLSQSYISRQITIALKQLRAKIAL